MIINLNSDFKPVVRFNKEIPRYYVNRVGDIFSTFKNKVMSPKTKWEYRKDGSKRLRAMSVTLSIPKNYYNYDHRGRGKKSSSAISIDIHRIVMETYKSIDKNPPEMVAECWEQIPEPAKEWIRRTAYVDHIDNDPTNNNVDNLRWVMPIENEPNRKVAFLSCQN